MRVSAAALAILVFGCGGTEEPPSATSASPTPPEALAPAPALSEAGPPVFPEGTRSLELTRTVAVRLDPATDAKRIGTLAIDTRVRWTRTTRAKGCDKPWVEVEPRGWICGDYVAPSTRSPLGREVPYLERGELVPGVYGKVTAPNAVTYALEKPRKDPKKDPKKDPNKARPRQGPVTSTRELDVAPATKLPEPKMIEDKPLVGSVTVRQYGELTVGGKRYWKVSPKDNEYILASAIRQHRPSLYGGARLGDETGWSVPVAFVWPRGNARTTSSMVKPTGGGTKRQLGQRTPVAILETSADAAGKPVAYRIADGEWIRAADVRVFQPAPPPPTLLRGERWIDVDLDSQILVAFEGELPVYATMVSSGTKDTPTETGIYRMWLKQSEGDMKDLKSEDPYSVATVPWTQFFSPERGLALHTAYWHDQFGQTKSHGCVNLAPRDARWLYFWSDPQVPPGWTMAAGVVEAPGSIVRVRTKDEPSPPVRGYAQKVLELRQQRGPAR